MCYKNNAMPDTARCNTFGLNRVRGLVANDSAYPDIAIFTPWFSMDNLKAS